FATSSSWVISLASWMRCEAGPGGAPALMLFSVECADGRRNGRDASLLSSLCAVCEAMRSMLRMERLTDLDERLLAALRNDGRAPIAALATRLGVSRATVTSRIDK